HTSPAFGWRRWAAPVVALAVLVLAYFGVIRPFQANLACRRGDTLADARSLVEYRRATELDPGNDFYQVRLAGAAMATGSPEDRQEAQAALERAAALVPADAY